ncbi:MAG: hypothetical protein ACOH1V_06665 [Stenotrophomonas sp.]
MLLDREKPGSGSDSAWPACLFRSSGRRLGDMPQFSFKNFALTTLVPSTDVTRNLTLTPVFSFRSVSELGLLGHALGPYSAQACAVGRTIFLHKHIVHGQHLNIPAAWHTYLFQKMPAKVFPYAVQAHQIGALVSTARGSHHRRTFHHGSNYRSGVAVVNLRQPGPRTIEATTEPAPILHKQRSEVATVGSWL